MPLHSRVKHQMRERHATDRHAKRVHDGEVRLRHAPWHMLLLEHLDETFNLAVGLRAVRRRVKECLIPNVWHVLVNA